MICIKLVRRAFCVASLRFPAWRLFAVGNSCLLSCHSPTRRRRCSDFLKSAADGLRAAFLRPRAIFARNAAFAAPFNFIGRLRGFPVFRPAIRPSGPLVKYTRWLPTRAAVAVAAPALAAVGGAARRAA
jgi:hypothetical protein